MSCQLSIYANFQDIRSAKKYLFPDSKDVEEPQDTEGWDDSDWGWNVEPEEPVEQGKKNESLSWLQECQVSISPVAELMALANDDKLVLLGQKYNADDDEVQVRYSLIYEGCVRQEDKESITSVLCLPLASQKRSTHGGPDWTCVIVGFSSGYVRMYTENGTLLLSQIFSEEPVVNIKCKTYEPPRHAAEAEKHEELNILYKKALVSIDGFSLFQSLRGCRNQVARAAASGSEWMQPPPLAYKKWALQDQDDAMDQISCGTQTTNPFDQMVSASMVSGFAGSIRSTPPASHIYLASGRGPYTGFYYIVEGSAQPMLSDVAHAVASKLKSALFSQISAASGWFGMSGRQAHDNGKEKKKPKIEPATSVASRYGLHDKRRLGESIVLSPNNKLAATTDSFGRVILIDILQGIAVRIWKGYRDAQVGWIEVKEDAASEREPLVSSQQKRAMFLVIYAPRRGILEIWTAQQGSRVAAFNVSKWARLLCPSYGMMGLNNVTYKEIKVQCHQIFLIDPDGVVKILDVPFHLALSDKNSKRARDLHLLKKLKVILKENNTESPTLQAEVIDTLLDMKIATIRHQGLERVLICKYLSASFLDTVIKAVMKHIEAQATVENQEDGQEGLGYDSKILLHFCKAEQHLLQTYLSVSSITSDAELKEGQGDIENLEEKLAKILSLYPEEIVQLRNEIDLYEKTLQEKNRVKFESDFSMSVVEFLSCFECERHKDEKSASGLTVQVFKGLSEGKKTKLANFMFSGPLCTGTSSEYNLLLKESHILPEDLMNLLLHLWLSEEGKILSTIGNLYSLVKSISLLKNGSAETEDVNEFSGWWQYIREQLIATEYLSSALLIALVCRSVAMQLGNASLTEDLLNSSTDSNNGTSPEWESVTMDKTQWTILVKQLEDLLVLQCLLKMKPIDDNIANRTAWEIDPIAVTVKRVLDGGRGMLPEFVAKWLAGSGIPPSMLCLSQEATQSISRQSSVSDPAVTDIAVKDSSGSSNSKDDGSESGSENPIVAQLQAVQTRLPYSLDSDILMANCSWEYMVLWNKDPEVILPLELALAYLKCIQNAMLQHGVSVMMWQMFIVKKFSSSAFLMEKVGKAPKDRLCRKEVGLSEISLEKFMCVNVELLDIIMQSQQDSGELPRFNVEDLWQNVQGPSSLVELALEQKESTLDLVQHHYDLCVIMHAVLVFGMKSVKPISFFDAKGSNAFFKPLPTIPTIPKKVDESITSARTQFLCRVLTNAVLSLGEPESASPIQTPSPSTSPTHNKLKLPQSSQYTTWPGLCLRLAKDLGVELDDLRRHQCCELLSSGFDKLAEEVLLSINNHPEIGSQLLVIAGKRLHHFIFLCDPPDAVEKLSLCSTSVSTWLKTLDSNQLRCLNTPLSSTASLVGHAVNQLPEGHSEYKLAIELVELVQNFV